METNFNYNNIPVRTVTDENEQIWFAGVDVCKILDYADPEAAIKKLDEDERNLNRLRDGSGQLRKTWTVNEFGLFSLILTSTKPEAKEFKRWVTHEVLPSIRKAGKYTTEEAQLHDAELRQIASDIEALKEKKESFQGKINEIKKEIESKTAQMIDAVKNHNTNQTRLQFPAGEN